MEPEVFASLIRIDADAPETRVAQLYRAIRGAVLGGHLARGEALPSSRAAAMIMVLSDGDVRLVAQQETTFSSLAPSEMWRKHVLHPSGWRRSDTENRFSANCLFSRLFR